jgi:hypothetical protein
VFTSPNGPPPGSVPGGPNKDFSIPGISPPGGQPPMKSYREWNTGWNGTANENSWEITEAGIYTQAAYISLLVRVIANGVSGTLPLHILSLNANRNNNGAVVKWEVSPSDETISYELQRSTDRIRFAGIAVVSVVANQSLYSLNDYSNEARNATVYYRVKETDRQGRDYYSSIVSLPLRQVKTVLSLYPNPSKNNITLSGYTAIDDQAIINITDATGKQVYRERWMLTTGNYSKVIAIESLAPGIYSLQLSGKAGNQQVQFYKQ